MTATIATLRAGSLVRLIIKSRQRAPHEVVARWEGVDAETALAIVHPADRVGRLYLDPAEIRAVEVIDTGRGKP